MRTLKVSLVLTVGLLCGGLALAACGGAEATPTGVSTIPARSATPTAGLVLDGPAQEGLILFTSKTCAACHGANGEGTFIAPALGGHSDAVVRRQVRAPVGVMPVFPPDKITNDELDRIAAFITALAGDHLHQTPSDLGQALTLHHWMALFALEGAESEDAIHHVEHIVELVSGDHLARMLEVFDDIEAGRTHDATHTIEEMLAGTASQEVTNEILHLQLALSASRIENAASAVHHIDHLLDVSTDDLRAINQQILTFLQTGEFHEAEDLLEGLLETTAGGGDLDHDDDDAEEEEHTEG